MKAEVNLDVFNSKMSILDIPIEKSIFLKGCLLSSNLEKEWQLSDNQEQEKQQLQILSLAYIPQSKDKS